jgi:molybdopterin-guanine dinucleotide biosynthesis protein
VIFHPYEFSFCGYSNSGKTTLITKLLEKYSAAYDVAYIKNDAHKYQMDKEGKDTWCARKAGARVVSINDKVYYLRTIITKKYVHSAASNNKEKHPEINLFKLKTNKINRLFFY